MARAPRLHRGGRGFEPLRAHNGGEAMPDPRTLSQPGRGWRSGLEDRPRLHEGPGERSARSPHEARSSRQVVAAGGCSCGTLGHDRRAWVHDGIGLISPAFRGADVEAVYWSGWARAMAISRPSRVLPTKKITASGASASTQRSISDSRASTIFALVNSDGSAQFSTNAAYLALLEVQHVSTGHLKELLELLLCDVVQTSCHESCSRRARGLCGSHVEAQLRSLNGDGEEAEEGLMTQNSPTLQHRVVGEPDFCLPGQPGRA